MDVREKSLGKVRGEVYPQSCFCFIFTFLVFKGEVGKKKTRLRTKPCYLSQLVNSLTQAMLGKQNRRKEKDLNMSQP